MRKRTIIFIIGLSIAAFAVYSLNFIFDLSKTGSRPEAGEKTNFSLLFTVPEGNQTKVAAYSYPGGQWKTLKTFSAEKYITNAENGFIVSDYWENKGGSEYFSYSGELLKKYPNIRILTYQKKDNLAVMLGKIDQGDNLMLFTENAGGIKRWSYDELSVSFGRELSFAVALDGRTVLYSFGEKSHEAQHSLNLRKLDLLPEISQPVLSYSMADSPYYVGYENSMNKIYISRNVKSAGFEIISVDLSSLEKGSIYQSAGSYFVGSLVPKNGLIVFSEHSFGSDESVMKVLQLDNGLVIKILKNILPVNWIDSQRIVALDKKNSYCIVDVNTGKIQFFPDSLYAKHKILNLLGIGPKSL